MRKLHRVRGEEIEPQANNVLKGQLTVPDSQIEKIDKQLEKIEVKTDKLIEKSNKIIGKSSSSNNSVVTPSTASGNKKRSIATKKQPSFIEFLCLKGLPKLIANHISKNMFFNEQLNQFICVIDSDDIKQASEKDSSQEIANTVYRMQASGWFKTINHSNSGVRLVSINNPEFFRS